MKRVTSFSLSLTFFFTGELFADTARMEKVAEQLGIEAPASSPESREAQAAIERLVNLGLSAYPTMKEREAEVAARKMEKESAVATYQPTLSLNANATRQDAKDSETNIRNRSDGHDASLVLRQNLYRGGLDSGQVDISRQNLAIAENNQNFERENLSFAIRRAILEYNYRSLRQLIDETSYQDASDLRSLADRKLEAGQVGKIDLYTTTMRESTAKAAAVRSSTETSQAEQRLLNLLGPQANLDAVRAEVRKLSGHALPYPEQMPLLAGEKVQTFEEKNAEAVAKRADLTLSQGYHERFLPSLDLVGQLSRSKNNTYYNIDNSIDTRVNSSGTFVQLQLNWLLYERRLDYRNKALAEEKLLAEAQSSTAQYKASTEVLRIRSYVQELYKNLGPSVEAYKASGQLYDAQRRLYESGVIGIQPLIDAEAEKRIAIANWHENVYELQLNLMIWDAIQRGFLPST